MSISNESIGKRIANVRKAAKLTQAELSEKIGISEKYLSRIECGRQLPSIAIVTKICIIATKAGTKAINNIDETQKGN